MNFIKKIEAVSIKELREIVEKEEEGLSIVQQCILLSIYRSGIYYQPDSERELDLKIILEIDKYYTLHPYYRRSHVSMCYY